MERLGILGKFRGLNHSVEKIGNSARRSTKSTSRKNSTALNFRVDEVHGVFVGRKSVVGRGDVRRDVRSVLHASRLGHFNAGDVEQGANGEALCIGINNDEP